MLQHLKYSIWNLYRNIADRINIEIFWINIEMWNNFHIMQPWAEEVGHLYSSNEVTRVPRYLIRNSLCDMLSMWYVISQLDGLRGLPWELSAPPSTGLSTMAALPPEARHHWLQCNAWPLAAVRGSCCSVCDIMLLPVDKTTASPTPYIPYAQFSNCPQFNLVVWFSVQVKNLLQVPVLCVSWWGSS